MVEQKSDDKYVDMIAVIDPKFIYATTSQPTTSFSANRDEGISSFCTCGKKCTEECLCVKNNGVRYTNDGKMEVVSDKPAFECNYLCKCGPRCGNKVVTKGPHQSLTIKQTAKKGYGLFATNTIRKGSFICEYAGEVVTPKEAEIRYREYKTQNICNYIFWLRERISGTSRITRNVSTREILTIIDPTYVGNIGRFINHSCVPNCHIIPIRIDSVHPKLCLFAHKQISKGSEITYDYGINYIEESIKNETDEQKILCYCDEFTCKKYLPYHRY